MINNIIAVSYTHLDVYKRQGRYGGKGFLELPASMHPAACDRQVFLLLFQRVVDLIAIRDTDPGKILQELPGMGSISSPLILI